MQTRPEEERTAVWSSKTYLMNILWSWENQSKRILHSHPSQSALLNDALGPSAAALRRSTLLFNMAELSPVGHALAGAFGGILSNSVVCVLPRLGNTRGPADDVWPARSYPLDT